MHLSQWIYGLKIGTRIYPDSKKVDTLINVAYIHGEIIHYVSYNPVFCVHHRTLF